MVASRVCSVIFIVLGLLSLVVATWFLCRPAAGRYPRARPTSGVVLGDHNHSDNLILWRRKMIGTEKHTSPSSPHNFRRLLSVTDDKRFLGASFDHEDRPPSPETTKNTNSEGTSDDVTMKKVAEVDYRRRSKWFSA